MPDTLSLSPFSLSSPLEMEGLWGGGMRMCIVRDGAPAVRNVSVAPNWRELPHQDNQHVAVIHIQTHDTCYYPAVNVSTHTHTGNKHQN